jgi:hypothetical protein
MEVAIRNQARNHSSDNPGAMTGKELLSANIAQINSVIQRRPARCNDTEGSLECESPNADAVWTT